MDDRGVSEVVGIVLLTAVVVILTSVISMAVLTQFAPGASPPRASFEADVNATSVEVTHTGVERVPVDDLTVVLRGPNATVRYEVTAANVTGGAGGVPAQFEPGERWQRDHGLSVSVGDRVQVLVVHEPTNAALYEGRRIVD